MNGPGHYALGVTAGVVWVHAADLPWWQAVIAVPVAAGCSYAALSPDIDGTKLWQFADRIIPDEWFGNSGPMRHRGVAHWWGLYAALTWWLYAHQPEWAWLAGAVLAGWWSHLCGDFLIGAKGQGRGPGIPVFPWWGHVGFGAHCGGWVEKFWATVVPLSVFGWMAWTLVA